MCKIIEKVLLAHCAHCPVTTNLKTDRILFLFFVFFKKLNPLSVIYVLNYFGV